MNKKPVANNVYEIIAAYRQATFHILNVGIHYNRTTSLRIRTNAKTSKKII